MQLSKELNLETKKYSRSASQHQQRPRERLCGFRFFQMYLFTNIFKFTKTKNNRKRKSNNSSTFKKIIKYKSEGRTVNGYLLAGSVI